MGRPRRYSPEVRERAVRLVFEHAERLPVGGYSICGREDRMLCGDAAEVGAEPGPYDAGLVNIGLQTPGQTDPLCSEVLSRVLPNRAIAERTSWQRASCHSRTHHRCRSLDSAFYSPPRTAFRSWHIPSVRGSFDHLSTSSTPRHLKVALEPAACSR